MPVSRPERERLQALLAVNGLTHTAYKRMTTPTLKKRAFRIAMSRTPDNEATPWAVLISDEDKEKIREAWLSRI